MKALSYLTDDPLRGLMIILTIVALVVGSRNFSRQREFRIVTFYVLFSLITDLFDLFRYCAGIDHTTFFQGVINCLFILFEYTVFSSIILSQVHGIGRRRAIKVFMVLFPIYQIEIIFRHPDIITHYMNFYFFESLFLTFSSLLYFLELFIRPNGGPLKDRPAFWFITGVLFVSCGNIPMLGILGFLGIYWPKAYELNYILYILFFCLIIRAYFCKPYPALSENTPPLA